MTPNQIAAKPADKRTPIEQAILIVYGHTVTFENSEFTQIANDAFRICINDLQALLPAEREAIERAYNEGQSDPEIRNGRIEKFCDSSFYFTQTYGK